MRDEEEPGREAAAAGHRSGVNEEVLEHPAHRRYEGVDATPSSLHDPEQVDAGGEDFPGAGEDHGTGLARVVERPHDGVAQLDVEDVRLAVLDAQDGDAVTVFAVDHRHALSRRR